MTTENPFENMMRRDVNPVDFVASRDLMPPVPSKSLPESMGGTRLEKSLAGMDAINDISVPNAWQKEINEARFGQVSKSISFLPPGGEGAALSVYDRGFPVGSAEGDRFKSILGQKPHVLNAEEIAELGSSVLGTIGDQSAFNVTRAETKQLNGRTILSVEGAWKEGGKKFIGCFAPKDDSGRDIQEVYFEAEEPHFSKHKGDALKSMDSIHWRKNKL